MNEPTEPLSGYGTHLRRSRDELVAENEKLLARATKEMLDHETTKARVEQIKAENKRLRDALVEIERQTEYEAAAFSRSVARDALHLTKEDVK